MYVYYFLRFWIREIFIFIPNFSLERPFIFITDNIHCVNDIPAFILHIRMWTTKRLDKMNRKSPRESLVNDRARKWSTVKAKVITWFTGCFSLEGETEKECLVFWSWSLVQRGWRFEPWICQRKYSWKKSYVLGKNVYMKITWMVLR